MCGKVRAHLPAAIRARLEEVERRMRAGTGPSIAISYTTDAHPAATAAPSPRPLPVIPPGGEGGETDELDRLEAGDFTERELYERGIIGRAP